MVVPKEDYLKEIRTQFNIIEFGIRQQMELFDDGITHISELFIEELLNIIFKEKGYYFKNLNYKRKNHPAVDLGDEINQISWQVTATNSKNINDKIKNTIESFFIHQLDNEFKELHFFLLTGKPQNINIPQSININGKNVSVKRELINKERIWDFNDLYQYIEELNSTILFEEIIPIIKKIPRRPVRPIHKLPEKYIQRTVVDNENKKCSIIQLLNERQSIVLMGFGGMGKSTEVDFIASHFSQLEDWLCYKINLFEYATTLEELINAYCKNWMNSPTNQNILFMLDGLDEVGSESLLKIYNESKQFIKKHERPIILISCRNNFFHYASTNEKNNKDFTLLYLEDISKTDINDYITKECFHATEFKKIIEEKNFYEVLQNPFFLNYAVKMFNDRGVVPKNKSDFFDQLLTFKISEEEKKIGPFHEIIRNYEYEIESALTKLAFVMQLAGKYHISNIDFNRIINRLELKSALHRIILRETNKFLRFEHNNFQEYLAAKVLSTLDWEIVKNVMILSENNKLRPRWLNTFSFLINILPNDSRLFKCIIRWALEFDNEILIKIEADKIDLNVRELVLKQIFYFYKSKEMIIWKSTFTIEELAKFGDLHKNNQVVINFLLSEIEIPNNNLESISNVVYLLQNITDISIFKEQILKKYIPLIDLKYETFGTLQGIFEAFNKWKLYDKEIFSTVIEKDLIALSEYARSEICDYFLEGRFDGFNAGYLFKCYKTINEKESRVYGNKRNLSSLLALLHADELVKFIFFLKNINYRHEVHDHIELFKTLIDIAIDRYSQQHQVKSAIIELMYCLRNNYRERELSIFKTFFEKTRLSFECFKELIKNEVGSSERSYYKYVVPCAFINDECYNWLLKEYSNNAFTDKDIWHLLIVLGKFQSDYHDKFYESINKISDNKYIYKPSPWQDFELEKDRLMFEAILDKEKLILYILNGFEIAGKDNLTREEVIKFEYQERKEFDVAHHLSFDFLRDFGDEIFDKTEIILYINEPGNWERHLINFYYEIIQHKNLPDLNKNWVINWYKEVDPHSLRFSVNETKKVDSYTLSYDPRALLYTVFSMYLEFIPSEKILLEMTNIVGIGLFNLKTTINSTTKEYLLSDFILNNTNERELSERLTKNLIEGIQPRFVLMETAILCEKIKLKNISGYMIPYLKNNELDKYFRYRILEVFINLEGNAELLTPIISTLTLNHSFDYKLTEYLIGKNVEEIKDFLLLKKDDETVDKLKVGYYLLMCNQLCGFDLLTELLSTTNKSIERGLAPDNDYFRVISIPDVHIPELIEYFLKILEIYLQKGFIKDEFDDSIAGIFAILINIFSNDKNCWYTEVIKRIEASIENSETSPVQKYIRYQFAGFKEKLRIQIDKEKEIENALEDVKQFGIFLNR